MATFNGSLFIKNQLLSLQQQTFEDWTLWVRDDGSSDNTVAIIEKFAERDKRIKLIKNCELKKLGVGKNFLKLTELSTAKYAIFCDQDDIWFEKKIEMLVDYADKNFTDDVPALVYCDGYGYSNEKGEIIIESISRAHAVSLNEFLFFNAGYQGCSMLFNKKLCSIVAKYKADYFYMHDDIVSLLAHSMGVVAFVPKKLMLYRQHSRNVTGNIKVGFRSLISRVLDFQASVISIKHYNEKKAFFLAYKDEMSIEDAKLFEEYLRFPFAGIAGRVYIIIRNKFSLGGCFVCLLIKTIIRKPIG